MIVFVYFSYETMDGFSWKYFFFLQNFASETPHFFSVAWSLTVEEWFYISFPLTSIGLATLFPKWKVKHVVLATILLFLLLPLAARFYFVFPQQNDPATRLYLIRRIRGLHCLLP
jgi:peptidoglycan/LPS O-acetylase OafA/YrhL